MKKMKAYSLETEARMRSFYGSLSEKDHRRYAAVEAAKLGNGGITYICGVLQCDIDRFKAGDIGEALFKGGTDFVESEGIGVVLAEAGRIVGNGLIAGPGFLQGSYFRGIKGRREFHAQELGDLFCDVVVRHGDSPARVYGKSDQFDACS